MKQQTAVELLMVKSFGVNYRNTINDYQLNAFQEAIELEKQQIIDAKDCWFEDERDGEQYYNETFGHE